MCLKLLGESSLYRHQPQQPGPQQSDGSGDGDVAIAVRIVGKRRVDIDNHIAVFIFRRIVKIKMDAVPIGQIGGVYIKQSIVHRA